MRGAVVARSHWGYLRGRDVAVSKEKPPPCLTHCMDMVSIVLLYKMPI